MDTTKKKLDRRAVELVHDWNVNFPENPITEKEVVNPSEVWFRSSIIFCLKNLKINTHSFASIDCETGTRLKLLRCRLLAWTNEILQFSIENANFKICYMDLLAPKRAVILTCLHYLVNYYTFYKQAYENSIQSAHKAVKEFEDLKTQKNSLKRSIEASKLTRDVQSTITSFKHRAEVLKKDLQDIQQTNQICDTSLHELRSQITTVTANIVPDHEARTIIDSKSELKQQLQEQDDIINSERNRLQGMSQNIETVQSAVSKMEQIMCTCSIDVSDLKNMKNECDKLEANVTTLRHNISRHSHEIQVQSQTIDTKKMNITQLQAQANTAELTYNEKMKDDQSLIKQRESVLKSLEAEENKLYDAQIIVKEKTELMYNVSSNMIKQMSESIYE